MLYQQGDVLIEKIETIPENTKEVNRTNGQLVLAEGEATGHLHSVKNDGVTMFKDDKEVFLTALNEFTVTHQEHKHITLPSGKYRVRKVKEYDHFMEEAREVRD